MMTPTDDVIADVSRERDQQVAKGYDFSHDDSHTDGSLAVFAAKLIGATGLADHENWTGLAASHARRKYPDDPRRLLVIAAATLVAEIERIDRLPTGTPAYQRPLEQCHLCQKMTRDWRVRNVGGLDSDAVDAPVCGECRAKRK